MLTLRSLLETESGYILVSLLLIFVSAIFWAIQMPKSEDVLIFALGVLSRSMGSRRRDTSQQPE